LSDGASLIRPTENFYLFLLASCLLPLTFPAPPTFFLYLLSFIFSCLSLVSIFHVKFLPHFSRPVFRERLFNFPRPRHLLCRCLFVYRRRYGRRAVDSGYLLANHAHWHRDPLKWCVCLCRSGDAYAPVLSAHCLAYHPALYSWVRDRGFAGHLNLFQPVRSSYRTDAWHCHALVQLGTKQQGLTQIG